MTRKKQIVSAVINGEMPTDLARRYELSLVSIYNYCKEFGVKIPKNYIRRPVKAFTVLRQLYDIDKSMIEIADDLGISRQRVSEIYCSARKAGIPGLPKR